MLLSSTGSSTVYTVETIPTSAATVIIIHTRIHIHIHTLIVIQHIGPIVTVADLRIREYLLTCTHYFENKF